MIVDVSLVFVILVNIFFVTLLLLKDANSELVFGRKLLDVLLRTIQPVDNPREGTMDENLAISLNSVEAVSAFSPLYKFVSSYVLFRLRFHLASFEILSAICVAFVIVVFVASVPDLEMKV